MMQRGDLGTLSDPPWSFLADAIAQPQEWRFRSPFWRIAANILPGEPRWREGRRSVHEHARRSESKSGVCCVTPQRASRPIMRWLDLVQTMKPVLVILVDAHRRQRGDLVLGTMMPAELL